MIPISQSVTLHRLERFARYKHSSLSCPFMSYEVANITPETIYTTLKLLMNGCNKLECYIRLGWKGLQEQIHLFFGPIHKLYRKLSVVNTTLHKTFTKLHFLCSLRMDPISQRVTQRYDAVACHGQSLQLMGLIRQLRIK